MLPRFLLPETVAREDGTGAEVALDQSGDLVRLTLGITRIVEQESLDVSIWGSDEGESWRWLAGFPHKCYCGRYPLTQDLGKHRDVRRLRVQWSMERWGAVRAPLMFGFYVYAEPARARHAGAA
jgi:hypothetical protein